MHEHVKITLWAAFGLAVVEACTVCSDSCCSICGPIDSQGSGCTNVGCDYDSGGIPPSCVAKKENIWGNWVIWVVLVIGVVLLLVTVGSIWFWCRSNSQRIEELEQAQAAARSVPPIATVVPESSAFDVVPSAPPPAYAPDYEKTDDAPGAWPGIAAQ